MDDEYIPTTHWEKYDWIYVIIVLSVICYAVESVSSRIG